MKFSAIDMENWERKDCFNHFMNVAKCTYSLTVNMDITNLYKYIKEKNYRLYPTFTWIVSKAINSYSEFRMSFDSEGRLGCYDEVNPCYSVLDEKTKIMDSLCTEYDNSFICFYKNMVNDMDNYKTNKNYTEFKENFFLVSCLPWLSYSSFEVNNQGEGQFLFPMVTWGKFYNEGEKVLLPLTLQVHHAVADGYHCSLFYNKVEEIINNPSKYLI